MLRWQWHKLVRVDSSVEWNGNGNFAAMAHKLGPMRDPVSRAGEQASACGGSTV